MNPERAKFIFYTCKAYILLPLFLWRVRARRREYRQTDTPRILVVPIFTRVGDLVCATPVFRAIKLRYPGAHLSVAVSKKVIGLIQHNPRIDNLINIDEPQFRKLDGRGRLFRYLGEQNYDWVICLANTPLNNLFSFYSFAPHRVKTVHAPRSLGEVVTDWFNDTRIEYKDHTFVPGHYLKLLEPLGISDAEYVKEIYSTPETERRADIFFAEHGISPDDVVIAVSITAGNKIKEWGDEKFAELVRRIVDQYDVRVIFTGTKAEEERVQKAIATVGRPGLINATGFTLDEFAALFTRLCLFLGVDTGPIYIAHALGVPVIDIVGPVDPREQPPEDDRSIIVYPAKDIPPSSFVFKKPGPRDLQIKALESITVDRVMAAVQQLAPTILLRSRLRNKI